MTTVRIYEADYEHMDEVISKLFGDFRFVWTNKKVLVKPNILGPYNPEKARTTHPSIIQAIVKILRNENARVIVGDNPGVEGYGFSESTAKKTGILEASLGTFRNISKSPIKLKVQSRFTDSVIISKDILEADLLISVPKFKTHPLTRITGAVKNNFGFLVGGEKARLHALAYKPLDFAQVIVDIFQIRAPDLVIMDAVVGIEGKGSWAKNRRRIGKILVSDNAVSLDAVIAKLIGLNPFNISCLKIAWERGLGEIDIDKIEIHGELKVIRHFKMPNTITGTSVISNWLNKYWYSLFSKPNLHFRNSLCAKCGVCVENCPVGALEMREYPVLNANKCISCYCCHELCLNDAIKITGLLGHIVYR